MTPPSSDAVSVHTFSDTPAPSVGRLGRPARKSYTAGTEPNVASFLERDEDGVVIRALGAPAFGPDERQHSGASAG